MSFKNFSEAQGAPSKDVPEVKSKQAPAVAQPASLSDPKAADAAPAAKTE